MQDFLEEAEEMFEVTLDSPVGAVQRGNDKAVITIMDNKNGQFINEYLRTKKVLRPDSYIVAHDNSLYHRNRRLRGRIKK